MRLLLLTEFPRDFSTFQLVFKNLARVYARRGHRVSVAAGALRRGAAEKADVVHLHTAGAWTPRLARLARACGGRRLIVTFQDWENPDLPLQDAAARRNWERLLARAAAVTAVSRATAARLRRALPKAAARVKTVPNGVEDALLRARARRPRRPFILCPSRLLPYKGIDLALMAWRDACTQVENVDFVFCGPDHSARRFQRLARLLGLGARARFLGGVGRRGMRELLEGCLFSVLPSRHESFGVAALEAMAAGKAVLAARVDGPRDVVAHRVTGLLVPPGCVEPLRDGLLRLCRDARLRARLGRAGRRRARAFRWERIAGAYLPLYAREGPR